MRDQMSLIPFAAAFLVATVFSGTSSAEVGKKISVTSTSFSSVAQYPAMTDAMTVALPQGYKSKSNFLKVTTTYQTTCSGGDYMGSKIDVGGVEMVNNGLPFEALDEDAASQIVSKTYYLVPESQAGPAITAGSMVTLKLTSEYGTGCTINSGVMTVEALQ